MPPRHAYWTILIDDKPTAFRAREREELQPTLVQLQRKNPNVTMKWFARGRLWASREAEREDFQQQRNAAMAPRERRDERGAPVERRGADWRPGGTHKDPRDRFKKKNRPERAWSEKDPATQRDRDKPGYVSKARSDWRAKPSGPPRGDRPWSGKSVDRSGPPRDRRPWSDKPAPPNDRPWQTKPTGPRSQRKPWIPKADTASGFKSRGDRPWDKKANSARPPSQGFGPAKPRGDRPWSNKPAGGPPRGDHPWRDKPAGGPPRGDRPWNKKPHEARGDRPWSAKPPATGGKRPWNDKPRGPRPGGGPPRKRGDNEPDKD